MSRTLVCTGCSSGLGFEALRQFLTTSNQSSPPWRVLVGCRPRRVQAVQLQFQHILQATQTPTSTVKVLDLDLSSRASVKTFAHAVKSELGPSGTIDAILLSAAVFKHDLTTNSDWTGYTEEAAVNSFAQHYLLHLLEPTIPKDDKTRARVVFVSSSKQQSIETIAAVHASLTISVNGTNASKPMDRYSASKLVQMLTAQAWKHTLKGRADVVAVSPGFVPTSGLNRESPWYLKLFMTYVLARAPFATTLEKGASIIRLAIDPDVDDSQLKLELTKSEDSRKVVYIGIGPEESGTGGWKIYEPSPLVDQLYFEEQEVWAPSLQSIESGDAKAK
ncbi:hypothetical protein OIV83_004617 [Microbotryomycetes sp. JL201]|nr:hypothetical protein OIV83_004617 [Microbotryomycetes sp. JL201]